MSEMNFGHCFYVPNLTVEAAIAMAIDINEKKVYPIKQLDGSIKQVKIATAKAGKDPHGGSCVHVTTAEHAFDDTLMQANFSMGCNVKDLYKAHPKAMLRDLVNFSDHHGLDLVINVTPKEASAEAPEDQPKLNYAYEGPPCPECGEYMWTFVEQSTTLWEATCADCKCKVDIPEVSDPKVRHLRRMLLEQIRLMVK